MKKLALPIAILFAGTFISCGDSGTGPGNSGEYSISATVTPSGAGSVSPSSDTTYEEGKEIELQAKANEGYLFTGWSGDVESTDNPLVFTVDQDYTLTANFQKKNYPLTINTQGEGVVSEEVVEQKSKEYVHGTVVKLTASPATGYKFVEWKGDISSRDTVVTVTVETTMEVTAVFESPFAGGVGTEADPFKISTIEQFQKIDSSSVFWEAHYIQINDIDASATAGGINGITFTPLFKFEGSYDGQGYVISNLTIHSTQDDVGLFSRISSGARISNVTLENVDITGGRSTGSLAGHSDGKIVNSQATGQVHCIDRRCGGLIGSNRGSIESSFTDVEVTSTSDVVGGLVGLNRSEILNSFALGSVSGNNQVGGLAGATDDIGTNGFDHRIFRSYARGEVTGDDNVGGLIGYQYQGSYVSYCYATGKVTITSGNPMVGGFVGRAAGGTLIEHGYWDKENTGQAEGGYGVNSGLTGLTTAQMSGSIAETNMSDFDFVNIWKTISGGYPALFWE